MKGISFLGLIFAFDAILGLAQGNNMYTLKAGHHYVLLNVLTLIGCLIVAPTLWGLARRRDYIRAMQAYEKTGDQTPLHDWDRTYR